MNSVNHYENFPVASWLCPPALRAAVVAIYHYARAADDIADEGHASSEKRLQTLAVYRQALQQVLEQPTALPAHWPQIFGPLGQAIQKHQLPGAALHHLLDAFAQDIRYTADGRRYTQHAELLDYCQCSANPVGRLLLHLYGIHNATALAQSDAICSALQLINFWQDLSQDLARGRYYLPQDQLQQHGVQEIHLQQRTLSADQDQAAQALLQALCQQARALMQEGAPLVHQLPGRMGWELRLVVQGGLRILDKIAALQHRTWQHRPRLGKADAMLVLWRALLMRA